MQLHKDSDKIKAAGVQVVAISYDPVDVLESFSGKEGIKYPLLSDPKSRTIDAYRIRNESVRSAQQEGIPHPTTFVVDKSGIIRAKLPGTTRKRHTTDELIKAVEKMKEQ